MSETTQVVTMSSTVAVVDTLEPIHCQIFDSSIVGGVVTACRVDAFPSGKNQRGIFFLIEHRCDVYYEAEIMSDYGVAAR